VPDLFYRNILAPIVGSNKHFFHSHGNHEAHDEQRSHRGGKKRATNRFYNNDERNEEGNECNEEEV